MRFLELKIKPPILALVIAAAIWRAATFESPHKNANRSRVVTASALMLFGFAFMTAGLIAFRRARTTTNPCKPAKASTLVIRRRC